MSDPSAGFGKFVPGFDFLQSLAKGAAQSGPQIPGLSNWVAPTFSVEELEKRIADLKAVQFWLDQNGKALAATIQALEVQKMSLATLRGMNVALGDVAEAFKLKTGLGGAGAETSPPAAAAPAPAPVRRRVKPAAKAPAASAKPAPGLVDPMQWWGSLTQQFQQIAAGAMKDAAKQAAVDTTKSVATGIAKGAVGTAVGAARAAGQMATAATRSFADGARQARTRGVAGKKAAARRR